MNRLLRMQNKLFLILITALLYWVLVNYVPYGMYIVLPVNLFVTFLHELGHSVFAVLTGGSVYEVMIQPNGAGYAVTSGGFAPLVLMGGYIGSALFGNLLLYIGLKKQKMALVTVYIMALVFIASAIILYSSLFTSLLLVLFSVVVIWISRKSKGAITNFLIVTGTASIIYIINDYNVGPSSDIARFAKIIPVLPQVVWSVLWLAIVVFITWRNLKACLRVSPGRWKIN